jgi:hypothetical protein
MPPASRSGIGQLRGQLHKLLKPMAARLKSEGTACVSGGDKKDLENFINQLASIGVFIVPVGELECWLPTLKREAWSSKSQWLIRTFETMGDDASDSNYTKPATGDVWDFIGRARKWLHDPERLGMPD